MDLKLSASWYTSILALTGNDIQPVGGQVQYLMAGIYLLLGALVQAIMFGNLTVLVQ